MKNIKTFEEHLNKQYGKKGTTKRDRFDSESMAFKLGAMLKEARKKAHLTQEELAERTNTKKELHLENRIR